MVSDTHFVGFGVADTQLCLHNCQTYAFQLGLRFSRNDETPS
jgi:hypothetical protein